MLKKKMKIGGLLVDLCVIFEHDPKLMPGQISDGGLLSIKLHSKIK